MKFDWEEFKDSVRIEDVIPLCGAEWELKRGSKYYTGVVHESLAVDVRKQIFVRHSDPQVWKGDVIKFVELALGMSPWDAVEWIARQMNIALPERDAGQLAAAAATRSGQEVLTVAANWFHQMLLGSQDALNYCYSRGMTDAVLAANNVGYVPMGYQWRQALTHHLKYHGLSVTSREAVAMVGYKGDVNGWLTRNGMAVNAKWIAEGKVPGMMDNRIVFAHMQRGRCVYMSTRSIDPNCKKGFQKLNLNSEVSGIPRQMFFNAEWGGGRTKYAAVVEGPFDALSMSAMGVPTVAMCGLNGGGDENFAKLTKEMRKRSSVYIATDADDAGRHSQAEIAAQISPAALLVAWPGMAKDANDWLVELTQSAVSDQPSAREATTTGGAGGGASTGSAADALHAAWEDLATAATPLVVRLAENVAAARTGNAKAETMQQLVLVVDRLRSQNPMLLGQYWQQMADAIGDGYNGKRMTAAALKREIKAVQQEMDKLAKEQPDDDREVYLETMGGRNRTAVNTISRELVAVPEDVFFEIIYLPEQKRMRLAVREPSGKIDVVDEYPHALGTFVPGAALKAFGDDGMVRFPDGVGTVRDGAELLYEIEYLIGEFVDQDPEFLRISAIFCYFTWFYDQVPVTPYLRMTGDKGVGKTRWLEVCLELSYRGTYFSGASSEATFYRSMDDVRGSVWIDEADFQNSGIGSTMAQISTTGYRMGGRLQKTESDGDDYKVKSFDTYGPKGFASRGKMKDDAVGDRSLVCKGRQMLRKDMDIFLPPSFFERAASIRRDMLALRMNKWRANTDLNLNDYTLKGAFTPRLKEITTPLRYVMLEYGLKGQEKFILDYVKKQQFARNEEAQASLLGKVAEAILRWYDAYGEIELTMKGIARMVDRMMDIENASTGNKKKDDFSARAAGPLVDQLSFEKKRSNSRNRSTILVWDVQHMENHRERYGFPKFDTAEEKAITASLVIEQEAKNLNADFKGRHFGGGY